MKSVKFTAKQKLQALNMWRVEKIHWMKVCSKCKCTRVSLWRWKKAYNGTLQSLENKPTTPKTPHPNSQTDYEKELIIKTFLDHIDLSFLEIWSKIKKEHNYSRHFFTMYKYINKYILNNKSNVRKKYVPQKYHTPTMFAEKWQLDVKYVENHCYDYNDNKKFYQYTIIDEATRERFLFPYEKHNSLSSIDFIKRAIKHFGYRPKIIQTDNGGEFVNFIVDSVLKRLNIKHQRIKPRTPRHNGKAERSHRTDSELFYKNLKFSSLDELKEKMHAWMIRYNNKPISTLRNKNGKLAFQTPLEKRAELLEIHKVAYVPNVSF